MNVVFTVCNRTTLGHALTLGHSVMKYPGYIFYIGWVDNAEIVDVPGFVKVIKVTDLNIPQWKNMTELYYDYELLPACRPWFAKYIAHKNPDSKSITFLAPTVQLYESMDQIIDEKGGMLVTPHITGRLKQKSILDDKRILNIGMFHSGAWSIKKSEESTRFLDWWAERTIDRAKFDLCNGMCMDQLWLNFTLVRIPDARQMTHSGWHYGLHSVLNKSIELSGDKLLVAGKPLISVDFAGLEVFDPIWSDYVELAEKSPNFKKLHTQYKKVVNEYKKHIPTGKIGFGIHADIKTNRIFRNKLAGSLRSVTAFIDQF